jgi:hypothetical protein
MGRYRTPNPRFSFLRADAYGNRTQGIPYRDPAFGGAASTLCTWDPNGTAVVRIRA